MSEWRDRHGPRRVVGRPALAKSLAGLLIRVVRFRQHRARTEADQRWADRVSGAVADALAVARDEAIDGPVTPSETGSHPKEVDKWGPSQEFAREPGELRRVVDEGV